MEDKTRMSLIAEVRGVHARHLAAWLMLTAWGISGCGRTEMNYALSDLATQELNATQQEQLLSALDEFFGSPADPKVSGGVAEVVHAKAEDLTSGADSYRKLCMHCHGLTGDGNGPTAPFLNPKPRDYRRGIFKFTSTKATPTVYKPTRDDLRRTLKNGIPGTSMPSFSLYDDQKLERVIDYLVLLSIRGEAERNVVFNVSSGMIEQGATITAGSVEEEADIAARSWIGTDKQMVVPELARPPADAESVERGKKLFLDQKVQCFNCHGREGRGDGLVNETDPEKTVDQWGNRTKPSDLALGVFRGGGRPIDLFRRIHEGIKGTPMPAQAANLKDDQIWDLVNYVRTLAYVEEKPRVAKSGSASH